MNTIVRIYLQSGDRKELLQEFMATVGSPTQPGAAPAMLGMGPVVAGGALVSTAVNTGVCAASETWGSDIEALSSTLAREIVKSIVPFSIEQGWFETTGDYDPSSTNTSPPLPETGQHHPDQAH